jgi:short-subunit dehydrogenase
VLLTGATGGIGAAIAHALDERGARVILSGRRAEALGVLKSELRGRAEVMTADLAAPEGPFALAAEAGPVDVLVANAGLPGTGDLESFSAEEIDRVVNVNLRTPIQLARALLPGMRERGRGHIVLISSISGKIASPHSSIYCSTKFGLRGFGFAVHEELRGAGIGVTTVFPGFVREAGMFVDSGAKLMPGMGTSSPREVAEAVIKGIETNKAEIDVAPIAMRSGTRIFTAAPSLGAALSRALGGWKVAASVAAGQRDKRA